MNEVEFYLEDLKSKFTKIDPTQYYLAYSGGRDSHFLFWFIREYLHETRIPIVFSNTGMELPEIRERGLANADVVLKPAMKHFEIKEKYGIPLNTKQSDQWVRRYQKHIFEEGKTEEELTNYLRWVALRDVNYAPDQHKGRVSWMAVPKNTVEAMRSGQLHKVSPLCCKYLKKEPAKKYNKEKGRKEILGVMGSESWTRKYIYQSCFSKGGKFTPLWDLTEDLRNKIEEYYEIPVPHVYQYTTQTGCAGCPYGQHGKNKFFTTDVDLNLCKEGQRKFILEYFRESYEFKGYHFQLMAFL